MRLTLDDGPFGGFFATDESGRRYHCVSIFTPALFSFGIYMPATSETFWHQLPSNPSFKGEAASPSKESRSSVA